MQKIESKLLVAILLVLLTGLFLSSVLLAEKGELKSGKKAWLGIYMQDLTDDIAEALDLEFDKGVLINDVIDDSPAEEAGLEEGDVIVRFDRKLIEDIDALTSAMKEKEPGDEVTLEILRDDVRKDFTVTLGTVAEFKDKKFSLKNMPNIYFDKSQITTKSGGYLGVTLQSLGKQLAEYFEVDEGVLITEVEEKTPAEEAGLKAGDVIVKVDGKDIDSPSDVSEIIREHEEGDEVEIAVVRKGQNMEFIAEVTEREFDFDWFGTFDFDFDMPMIPGLPHSGDYDAFLKLYDDDLKEEMQELKEELDQLKAELKELQKELQQGFRD